MFFVGLLKINAVIKANIINESISFVFMAVKFLWFIKFIKISSI